MEHKKDKEVMVRKDLVVGKHYGGYVFTDDMYHKKGCKTIIKKAFDTCYHLAIDKGMWNWTDEMMEEIKEEKKMKYKVGDKVRIRKDLEVGKVYGGCCFVDEMLEPVTDEPKRFTIGTCEECLNFEPINGCPFNVKGVSGYGCTMWVFKQEPKEELIPIWKAWFEEQHAATENLYLMFKARYQAEEKENG